METALMYFRRGKTVANRVQRDVTVSLDTFKQRNPGRLATPEEMAKDRVEMPGPDFRLWKTDRGYIAFKDTGPVPTPPSRFGK
jgi:hypothetical protein